MRILLLPYLLLSLPISDRVLFIAFRFSFTFFKLNFFMVLFSSIWCIFFGTVNACSLREQNVLFSSLFVCSIPRICAVSFRLLRLMCFCCVVSSSLSCRPDFHVNVVCVFFFLFIWLLLILFVSSCHSEVYEIVRVTFTCDDVHYILHFFLYKKFWSTRFGTFNPNRKFLSIASVMSVPMFNQIFYLIQISNHNHWINLCAILNALNEWNRPNNITQMNNQVKEKTDINVVVMLTISRVLTHLLGSFGYSTKTMWIYLCHLVAIANMAAYSWAT